MNNFLLAYRHPSIDLYKPQINRKRQIGLIIAFIPFLLTIGTNWLYFIGLHYLFKFKPLFIYQ